MVVIVLAVRSPTKEPADLELPEADQQQSERGNSVYGGLTDEEVKQVISFLMDDDSLELSPASKASLDSNYIFSVEDYLPNKEDSISYLDGKSENAPERKARVILFMGKTKEVLDLLVWPIPNPQNKRKAFVNRPNGEKISWRSRPLTGPDTSAAGKAIYAELDKLGDIIRESFVPGCEDWSKCLFSQLAVRSVLNSPERHVLAWHFIMDEQIEDYYMYPIPLYLVLKEVSAGYEITKIYYNIQAYSSSEELIAAYNRDPSIRFKLPNKAPNIGVYGSPRYVKKGDKADDSMRPPAPVYPDGRRFSVSDRYVRWLDWSFNIHFRTITGIQMFDVRFNDERIAYELSMQDILVLYSGSDVGPDNFFKSYFDDGWSIGAFSMPLIQGVDCPPGAIYQDSVAFGVGQDKKVRMKDAVCIFEYRNHVPLRRHFSTDFFTWGYRYAFSMPDTVLVVRQMLTVWNYDYIFDYEFHQNGVVELKVTSTGYIAVSADLTSDTIKHGYIVNPQWNAGANLHQHLFNFKMDVDIEGTANRFKTINIMSEKIPTEFSGSADWYQMVMNETLIESEKDALVKYDFSKPKQYIVFNKDRQVYPNADNSPPRAYRVLANGFSKVVLPESSPLLEGGASWTKYQLAVTKHNENERGTASHFVQGDPYSPAVNFDKFVENDDSLVDADLVLWATVGLHHVPTYEDLPVTTTSGKVLSVSLIPFNFFERDPSIHSRDAVVFWNKSMFDRKDSFLSVTSSTCPAAQYEPKISA